MSYLGEVLKTKPNTKPEDLGCGYLKTETHVETHDLILQKQLEAIRRIIIKELASTLIQGPLDSMIGIAVKLIITRQNQGFAIAELKHSFLTDHVFELGVLIMTIINPGIWLDKLLNEFLEEGLDTAVQYYVSKNEIKGKQKPGKKHKELLISYLIRSQDHFCKIIDCYFETYFLKPFKDHTYYNVLKYRFYEDIISRHNKGEISILHFFINAKHVNELIHRIAQEIIILESGKEDPILVKLNEVFGHTVSYHEDELKYLIDGKGISKIITPHRVMQILNEITLDQNQARKTDEMYEKFNSFRKAFEDFISNLNEIPGLDKTNERNQIKFTLWLKDIEDTGQSTVSLRLKILELKDWSSKVEKYEVKVSQNNEKTDLDIYYLKIFRILVKLMLLEIEKDNQLEYCDNKSVYCFVDNPHIQKAYSDYIKLRRDMTLKLQNLVNIIAKKSENSGLDNSHN